MTKFREVKHVFITPADFATVYGFPKEVPKKYWRAEGTYIHYINDFNVEKWLIKEGYPPELAKDCCYTLAFL